MAQVAVESTPVIYPRGMGTLLSKVEMALSGSTDVVPSSQNEVSIVLLEHMRFTHADIIPRSLKLAKTLFAVYISSCTDILKGLRNK